MSTEKPPTQFFEGEANMENIDSYIEEGMDRALALIRERYENAPAEKLPFHGLGHTKGVINRAEKILWTLWQVDSGLVSERDISIGRLAAAYHDTVQSFEAKSVPDGEFIKILRAKPPGGVNEQLSVKEAAEFMDEVNSRGKTVFSQADKEVVEEAIMATVSAWDGLHGTVMQPNLKDDSSLIARAVALADLGNIGMEDSSLFIREGNALFREDNLDILYAFQDKNILKDREDYFKSRIKQWLCRSQPAFTLGRQARLYEEIQAIPKSARDAVAALFSNFSQSIAVTEKVARDAREMSFEELADFMGYT